MRPNGLRHAGGGEDDRGSITPLLLGLTLCLLLLVAGVTAAGSAFLGRSRLQNQCDGAALAASDAADVPGRPRQMALANDAAIAYLAVRPGRVGVRVVVGADTVTATCWTDTPITFGDMFFTPTLRQDVESSSRLRYDQA
ncbi:pilus assembly protein TadG-related protein [Nakamurella deserti]|uniref:pilus assembly protein TadG-related protein n=1 Tax=Nakamurella deserti TaxID=2164074 RepID=UPI001300B995|nr:pilus assembly protein TadG-related protein [Nakamurella deserti]